ncbi:MAG: RdgB/HAM1 family non-canonical purine NTP pyrophosphatase [Desulfurobacteriaceae bacterium]
MRIVFATKNRGKVKEAAEKLREFGIEVVPLSELGDFPAPEETGETFCENAYEKAVYYSGLVGEPVIAEDSGLVVDALGGRPGVYSSRFAGEGASDEENNRKLVEELKKLGLDSSPARYVSFVFLSFPEGMGLWSEGRVEGRVITVPRGEGGFGYDPLFVPEGFDRTMAELPLEEKNRISHRGKALSKLADLIKGVKKW